MLIRCRTKQRLWKDFTKSQKPGKHLKELTGKANVLHPHVINSLFKYIRPLLNTALQRQKVTYHISVSHALKGFMAFSAMQPFYCTAYGTVSELFFFN